MTSCVLVEMIGLGTLIEKCDNDVNDITWLKFDAIIRMTTTERVENIDAKISFLEAWCKFPKLEKQFYIAIEKKNWRLLKILREKLSVLGDKTIREMRDGVEIGWIDRTKYLTFMKGMNKRVKNIDSILNVLGSCGVLM